MQSLFAWDILPIWPLCSYKLLIHAISYFWELRGREMFCEFYSPCLTFSDLLASSSCQLEGGGQAECWSFPIHAQASQNKDQIEICTNLSASKFLLECSVQLHCSICSLWSSLYKNPSPSPGFIYFSFTLFLGEKKKKRSSMEHLRNCSVNCL